MNRDQIADIIAPMLADGRTAGSDGVPRVGRQTRKKALEIASRLEAILAADAGGWRPAEEASSFPHKGGLFWFAKGGRVMGPAGFYWLGADGATHFMPCVPPEPPPQEPPR
jgi:hypothetical protein